MIVRTWKGETTIGKAEHYLRHFKESVLPQLKEIAGYQDAYVLKQDHNEQVELVVMTMWESMAAVHKFAGDTPEKAVVEPEARAVLTDFDLTVNHYEVVIGPEL